MFRFILIGCFMQDALDYKVVENLIKEGRITWSDLANRLSLSPPAIADRVRRLEEKGIIKRYTAIIDYKVLGYSLTAFISISLKHPKYQQKFLDTVNQIEEIQECYHTIGDGDYLIKVRCFNTEHLESFLHEKLRQIPGIIKTITTVVLSATKEKSSVLLKNNKIQEIQNLEKNNFAKMESIYT